MPTVFKFLRARAENVLAILMLLMFVAFIMQVVFRYLIDLPLAWTDEVCNMVWLWAILWGGAFVLRNNEDLRFDMLYNLLSAKKRRVLTCISSVIIVSLLLISLPAAYSYVSFMKVEKSASLLIPMNWVYSIYLIFVVAMIVRHASIAWDALNGRLVEDDVSLAIQDATSATK